MSGLTSAATWPNLERRQGCVWWPSAKTAAHYLGWRSSDRPTVFAWLGVSASRWLIPRFRQATESQRHRVKTLPQISPMAQITFFESAEFCGICGQAGFSLRLCVSVADPTWRTCCGSESRAQVTRIPSKKWRISSWKCSISSWKCSISSWICPISVANFRLCLGGSISVSTRRASARRGRSRQVCGSQWKIPE